MAVDVHRHSGRRRCRRRSRRRIRRRCRRHTLYKSKNYSTVWYYILLLSSSLLLHHYCRAPRRGELHYCYLIIMIIIHTLSHCSI